MVTDESIKQLQEKEFNILLETLAICKKLDLRVYAVSGTCLGAVKYNNFIPWDDDIDLALPRRDYEIFIKEADKYLQPYYFLQTHETDPGYFAQFAKIRDSRTTFVEKSACKLDIHHGIYIDIFPLDGYPESFFKQKLFWVKKQLYSLRISKHYYSRQRSWRWKLMSAFSVLIIPSLERAWTKREALYRSVDFDAAETIGNFGNAWGKKEVVPKQYFSTSVDMQFANILLPIPCGYREYLQKLYGDISKDPPKCDQVPHHYALMIDVDKSYVENQDIIRNKVQEELRR